MRELWLHNNQLTEISSEIGHLQNLEKLWLVYNQIDSLPPEIGDLHNLRELDLRDNHLTHLPRELGQVTQLADDNSYLRLSGNPLISPPEEVIAQGTPAILDYLRHQTWWHLQRLILSLATGVGLLAVLGLGLRWKMRRGYRKSKRKKKAY